MSKGSNRRPVQVSNEEYSNRWDAIFGHDGDSPRTVHRPKAVYRQELTEDNQKKTDGNEPNNG